MDSRRRRPQARPPAVGGTLRWQGHNEEWARPPEMADSRRDARCLVLGEPTSRKELTGVFVVSADSASELFRVACGGVLAEGKPVAPRGA